MRVLTLLGLLAASDAIPLVSVLPIDALNQLLRAELPTINKKLQAAVSRPACFFSLLTRTHTFARIHARNHSYTGTNIKDTT